MGIVQVFTHEIAKIIGLVGKIPDIGSEIAEKFGQTDLAVSLKKSANNVNQLAYSWEHFGDTAQEAMNGYIKGNWARVQEIENERIAKANKTYDDTIVALGKDEKKLANSLMQSKAAVNGLSNAESNADKKAKKRISNLSAEQKELKALNDERAKLAAKILTDNATPEEEKRYIALTNSMKDAKEALKELTMSEADIFAIKQKKLGLMEKEIKLALYQNQDVTELVNKYNAENQALQAVNDKFNELTGNTGKQKSTYEKLNDELKKTRDLYKSMLVEGAGKDELESVRKRLSALEKEEAYLKRLQDREGVWKISSRAAKEFGDTIVDSIFTPLRDGENLWDRFKQAGIDALKAIAQEWAKNFLQNLVTGFSAGFSGSAIGGGGFLSNLASGIKNAFNLVNGKPLSIGANVSTTSVGGEDGTSAILDNLTFASQSFGSVLDEDVLPNALSFSSLLNEGISTGALSSATNLMGVADSAMSAGSSLLGAANPALATAQSMATMATCAPIAAMGMGMMSATMTIASAAFQKSAPALIQMAGAMTTLATEAATAAKAMAELAVATAAESVAKIPFVGGFLAPVASILTGAGIAAGTAIAGAGIGMGSSVAGAGQMFGSGMAGIGSKIIPHARGGIVSSPTMFPMQGGNIGLAGEAGSEAIAPVRRMSNGDLGVGAVQPKVTVNNYTNAAVEVIRRPDNEMEIKIKELNAMLSSSRSNKGMTNAQQRMQQSGRQIG